MGKDLFYDFAHDAGNGYMKDRLNGKTTIFPSVVANISNDNSEMRLDEIRSDKDILTETNFLDNMDVTIISDGLLNKEYEGKDGIRYLVGKAANTGSIIPQTFNVTSSIGKNASDISLICALSLISYRAISDYFKENSELPDSLNVIIKRFATDLPIDEYLNDKIFDTYLLRFTSHTHIVTVNSFKKPITVNISFRKASLQPEGIIAERGLIFSPRTPRLFRNDDIFNPIINDSQNNVNYFDGQTFYNAGVVILADIGEGTVDFALIDGASPLHAGNISIPTGIGIAIQEAIDKYHRDNPDTRKPTRQSFIKTIQQITAKGQDFKLYLDDRLQPLNDRILEQISTIYTSTDETIGIIVFAGGGATTLKPTLKPKLEGLMNRLDKYHETILFWVDSEYAQTLSLDGLQSRVLSLKDDD